MKKQFFIGVLILMMLIVTACGGAKETSQEPSKGNDVKSSGEKYVFKVSHPYPPTSLQQKTLEWYNDEIEKRSDGKLSLEIYPSGQLMPPGQELPALINGKIDMALPISSVIGSIDPIWY